MTALKKNNPAEHAALGRAERRTGASMQKLIRLHHMQTQALYGMDFASLRKLSDTMARD
jgi:hypothetical protein